MSEPVFEDAYCLSHISGRARFKGMINRDAWISSNGGDHPSPMPPATVAAHAQAELPLLDQETSCDWEDKAQAYIRCYQRKHPNLSYMECAHALLDINALQQREDQLLESRAHAQALAEGAAHAATIMERLLYVVSTHAKPTAEEAEAVVHELRAVLAAYRTAQESK